MTKGSQTSRHHTPRRLWWAPHAKISILCQVAESWITQLALPFGFSAIYLRMGDLLDEKRCFQEDRPHVTSAAQDDSRHSNEGAGRRGNMQKNSLGASVVTRKSGALSRFAFGQFY